MLVTIVLLSTFVSVIVILTTLYTTSTFVDRVRSLQTKADQIMDHPCSTEIDKNASETLTTTYIPIFVNWIHQNRLNTLLALVVMGHNIAVLLIAIISPNLSMSSFLEFTWATGNAWAIVWFFIMVKRKTNLNNHYLNYSNLFFDLEEQRLRNIRVEIEKQAGNLQSQFNQLLDQLQKQQTNEQDEQQSDEKE